MYQPCTRRKNALSPGPSRLPHIPRHRRHWGEVRQESVPGRSAPGARRLDHSLLEVPPRLVLPSDEGRADAPAPRVRPPARADGRREGDRRRDAGLPLRRHRQRRLARAPRVARDERQGPVPGLGRGAGEARLPRDVLPLALPGLPLRPDPRGVPALPGRGRHLPRHRRQEALLLRMVPALDARERAAARPARGRRPRRGRDAAPLLRADDRRRARARPVDARLPQRRQRRPEVPRERIPAVLLAPRARVAPDRRLGLRPLPAQREVRRGPRPGLPRHDGQVPPELGRVRRLQAPERAALRMRRDARLRREVLRRRPVPPLGRDGPRHLRARRTGLRRGRGEGAVVRRRPQRRRRRRADGVRHARERRGPPHATSPTSAC